jgi:hypothetical protein
MVPRLAVQPVEDLCLAEEIMRIDRGGSHVDVDLSEFKGQYNNGRLGLFSRSNFDRFNQ